MRAEIIAVGSELLLGQIVNTNAQFLSTQLAEMGINIHYHTVVGDNRGRLLDAIKIAESRADILLFSGGLGPTKDDLTKQTIAEHLGTSLVLDTDALQFIEEFFAQRKRPMTENNKQQALVFEGASVLKNHNGMAPGMYYKKEEHTYILLPGPPKELEPMFQYEAKPLLAKQVLNNRMIYSHVIRFFGIGEAELETRLEDLIDAQTNPTIAPLASDGEVTIRLTATGETEEEAWDAIQKVQAEIVNRVGKYVYGYNNDSLPLKLKEMLINQKLTIAAAESMTAGLFQAELATIPGMAQALAGGIIAYNEDVKINQLGVDPVIIDEHSVVSGQCAEEMARKIQALFKTDIGVGITGAAGPDNHGGQPAGTVWIGIAFQDKSYSYELHLSGMRNTNRIRAVKFTIHYLLQLLREYNQIDV
ncbi:competence/damage-inducible protein A [Chryseomicrobium excrementi]|uniref:Putative competence-damage inducible protein n=1 Tax=Chryseomicrobium excrementi TaxID=2041346 RepID=A0A2M9F2Z8_9BACL|nr:competence/damage-inducible protein A [Chryseomicrobium excrementi]PJK17842.1 competence/damage-inducible protein A [Chryseomicrobium excrementi]